MNSPQLKVRGLKKLGHKPMAFGHEAGWRLPLWPPLLLVVAITSAQGNFAFDPFTVDEGGGTSSGGASSIKGTAGQPDAGQMSGGTYAIRGGFWHNYAAVQTPSLPLLTITFNPQLSAIIVSWPYPSTGFTLRQSASVGTTTWLSVTNEPVRAGDKWQITVSPPVGKMFYRLLQTPGAPLLTITLNPQLSAITVSWPYPSTDFALQQSAFLPTTQWLSVTNVPVRFGDKWQITGSPVVGNMFYRLLRP